MIVGSEPVEGGQRHLEKRSDHDDRKDQDTQGLQTSATDGVAIAVLPADHDRRDPNDDRADKIQNTVNQGRQH